MRVDPGMYIRTTPDAPVEPVVASAPIAAPKATVPIDKHVAVTVEPIQQAVEIIQPSARSSHLRPIVTRINGLNSNLNDLTDGVRDYLLPSADYKAMPVIESLGLPAMDAREMPSLEAVIR